MQDSTGVSKSDKVVSGFEHINRYWDRHRSIWVAKILPGEFYISRSNELISTVLGSCISVCIHDHVLKLGGMNHFMLPVKTNEEGVSDSAFSANQARYGNWAIEYLLNELCKIGSNKNRMQIKVFGGAQVISTMTNVGSKNIKFAFEYLATEGLDPIASDTGDRFPRKVLFNPTTGQVWIKKLKKLNNRTIFDREDAYSNQLTKDQNNSNSIELF